MNDGEHGHETPEYWEEIYADGPGETPVDVLLPEVVAGLQPGTALDVGCGEGQNSRWLAERGWSVLGIDIALTAITRAREGAPAGVRFEVADARFWQPEGVFDLVISTYALGSRRDAVLAMAVDAVAPGGTAYVCEFDESADTPWPAEDLVSLDELVSPFDGFEISRAEVLTLPHGHGHGSTEWPVAVVIAQRPVR